MVAGVEMASSGDVLRRQLRGRIRNAAILDVIARLRREFFLDRSMSAHGRDDVALSIGFGQTTSQPFIIARMLEMLMSAAPPPAKILEVGVGCGYQTAILAELGYTVIGLERIRALATAAAMRLRALECEQAPRVVCADGLLGYEAQAPYDGAVICAECAEVPAAIVAQLGARGRMVLPLRGKDGVVRLCMVDAEGDVFIRREAVKFVPMLSGVK